MCHTIRETVYLLSELIASGETPAELMKVAQNAAQDGYSAEYLLELANRVGDCRFECAA